MAQFCRNLTGFAEMGPGIHTKNFRPLPQKLWKPQTFVCSDFERCFITRFVTIASSDFLNCALLLIYADKTLQFTESLQKDNCLEERRSKEYTHIHESDAYGLPSLQSSPQLWDSGWDPIQYQAFIMYSLPSNECHWESQGCGNLPQVCSVYGLDGWS